MNNSWKQRKAAVIHYNSSAALPGSGILLQLGHFTDFDCMFLHPFGPNQAWPSFCANGRKSSHGNKSNNQQQQQQKATATAAAAAARMRQQQKAAATAEKNAATQKKKTAAARSRSRSKGHGAEARLQLPQPLAEPGFAEATHQQQSATSGA